MTRPRCPTPLLLLAGLLAGVSLVSPVAHAAPGSGGAWELVDLPADSERFSAGQDAPVTTTAWWESFEDPGLSAAVDAALRASPDLAGAWDRVVQAEALAGQGVSALLPVITADGSVQYAPTESLGFGFGLPTQFEQEVYSQGSVGLNASLGVDLFGRRTTAWRAGRFDAEAARGDKDAAALALSTRTAQAYLDLVAAREQVALTRAQVEANEAILELTELRYQASGEATGLDVLQQRQQTEGARSRLPQAELAEALASQRLAVLQGRRASVAAEAVAPALPALPPQPGVGTPADLLEHRPDLRAAAARLDAARLRKQSAGLAMTPSLGVSAGVGQQFIDTDELTWQDYWNVGLSVSVPLFNGGALYQGLRQARAGERSAARSVDSALLVAIQEVEGALEQERRQQAVLEATRAQLLAAEAAFERARDRYGQGLATYQQVLTSLTAWQTAQLSELAARRDLLDIRISLHQSLGGTWTRQVAAVNGAAP